MLNEKKIAKLRKANKAQCRYRDEGGPQKGLYLQLYPAGGSWLLRYERGGRERWMGLGRVEVLSLTEARAKARAAHQLLADGVDPLDAKRAKLATEALAAAKVVSFAEAAQSYFEQHSEKWKNRKHAAQFLSTLKQYAYPKIGALPVSDVDTAAVLRVLEQSYHGGRSIWFAIPETADRLRGRIESVLDFAAVRGFRKGDNPARWKGHLDNVLPARSSKVAHHAALPFTEISAFMTELREREGIAAAALQFTILTAARTGETIGAQWDEIDLAKKLWTIPGERMKMKKEHRVPLSDAALKLLRSLPTETEPGFVFIGPRAGAGLSNMAMAAVLKRMGRDDVTVHGFRSCFRDWSAECTAFPNHVLEQALAHSIGDGVEKAYRRGDLLEKRRKLMSDWAKYCSMPAVKTSATVVRLRP
jgi:integrase